MSKKKSTRKQAGAPHNGCGEYQRLSRRQVLGWGGGLFASLAVPAWVPRVALAESENSDRDVMVSLFLRGGADGLTLCVPHGDDAYYRSRPGLAVPRPDSTRGARALDLDGFFGLPPALAPLLPAFQEGELALVHACGLPSTSRSHFDAMQFMETGTVSTGSAADGWLGRHLQATAPTRAGGLLRALSLGFALPQTLVGAPKALPIEDLAAFDFKGDTESLADRRDALEAMYAETNGVLGESARNTFRTVNLLKQIDIDGYVPAGDARYPETDLGRSLRSAAALIKAEVGVEAIGIDYGGWDTHDFQGPLNGQMADIMTTLAGSLAAFHADLNGSSYKNYVVVAMSEFGRNLFENGSSGTDHGHGGLMMTLGGHIAGGRVVADWPGLEREQLFEQQDLAITIDYRDVLWEILDKRLDGSDLAAVFGDPSFQPTDRGLVRS